MHLVQQAYNQSLHIVVRLVQTRRSDLRLLYDETLWLCSKKETVDFNLSGRSLMQQTPATRCLQHGRQQRLTKFTLP